MQQRKTYKIGAGWIRTPKNGGPEFISGQAAGNGMKDEVELFVKVKATGEMIPVTNFAGFFEQEKTNPKAPDIRFIFNQE